MKNKHTYGIKDIEVSAILLIPTLHVAFIAKCISTKNIQPRDNVIQKTKDTKYE
jgi:hypothetical protein